MKEAEEIRTEHLKELPDVKSSRYAIQFNFEYDGHDGKTMSQELKTQPDMTLTIRQLLQNHTRGANDETQVKTPLYFDYEVPLIKDLTDVDEYRAHLQEMLKKTEEFIKADKAKAEEAKKQEKDDKADANTTTGKRDSKAGADEATAD